MRPCLFTGGGIFIALFLIVGCGGDENATRPPLIEEPSAPQPSNYFPMTVGSWWRYRNPDGSEWTREIIDAREIDGVLYHFFSYKPSTENNRFDFLTPTAYAETRLRLIALIRASTIPTPDYKPSTTIDPTFWDIIAKEGGAYGVRGNQFGYNTYKIGNGRFIALENHVTEVTWHSDFVPLRYPIGPGGTYEALDIKLNGTVEFKSLSHSYEVRWSISGSIAVVESIMSPAGSFHNCVKIQYTENLPPVTTTELLVDANHDTQLLPQLKSVLQADLNKELKDFFMLVRPKLGFENMWLAPGVGPVKIETPNGIAELIDYNITPAQ